MPELKEIVDELIGNALKQEKIYSIIGKVSNVDEAKRICDVDPIGDEAKRFAVRLQSAISKKVGIVLIPKDGSDVIISFMNKTQAFVSLTSDLDKILIDTTLVQFNGGDNKGLVNVVDLTTQLNTIEKDINTLKTALSTWIVVPNDGGAALKSLTATFAGAALTPTVQADIEDTKVTH